MKKNKGSFQKELSARLKAIRASDVMAREAVTIRDDASLAEAARLLTKRRIDGMPVVDRHGRVFGIITAKDLFVVMDMIESGEALGEAAGAPFNATVRFAMSSLAERVTKNTPLDEVIALVKYRNFYIVPVFDGTRLAGVIDRRDIFKAFYAAVGDILRARHAHD